MPTANERLRDAAVRNAVFLQRYSASEVNKIINLLAAADADLVEQIAKRLERVNQRGFDLGPATTRRLQTLLEAIRTQSADLHGAMRKVLTEDLVDLAGTQAEIAARRFDEAVGVDLGMLRPSPELLRSAVTSRPFQGRLLKDWVKDLAASQVRDLGMAINLGIIEGQTTPQIIARVRENLDMSHRRAGVLVRTSINHVSTRAREMVYEANDDLVDKVQWISTLDNRTTPICRARDHKTFPVNKGPRPPAHPNCRSTTVPVLVSWDSLIGPKALKPERGASNIDAAFEKSLSDKGFKPEAIAEIKRNTRASMNGQVADELAYGDWLRTQPRAFVVDVMGQSKAKLFLDGDLAIDRFVDLRTGREFTLDELKRRESASWARAFN